MSSLISLATDTCRGLLRSVLLRCFQRLELDAIAGGPVGNALPTAGAVLAPVPNSGASELAKGAVACCHTVGLPSPRTASATAGPDARLLRLRLGLPGIAVVVVVVGIGYYRP